MKKNLISVIILALVFANFVLTALLMFTILPETKKANEMITAVCNAIDLELNSGAASGITNTPLDKTVSYSAKGGESYTVNLVSTDGQAHYAVVKVSLSLSTTSENYAKYSPEVLANYDDRIGDTIITIIGEHTADDMINNLDVVKQEILAAMQDMFGGDYVVAINIYDKQIS